jgi:hypothetical protein
MATKKRRHTTLNKTRSDRSNDHIHPSLKIKTIPGLGKGVFAAKPIKSGTVLVKETPHHLPKEPYDSEYAFKLAKHLMKVAPAEFQRLVPLRLNTDATCDVKITPEFKESARKLFPGIPLDRVKLYILKIRRNAFQFGEVSGILFFATRMNHSCEPNVHYERRGAAMVFKAKRDIAEGEEIYDSYIYAGDPIEKRKSALLARYGFDCGCKRCNGHVL